MATRFSFQIFGFIGCLCGVLATRPAHAIPEFPERVQAKLGMRCPPPCTLCHQDNNGGPDTIREDSFGSQMVRVGLEGEDDSNVERFIDDVEDGTYVKDGVERQLPTQDVDEDGVNDVDELREERDPNTPGEGVVCGPLYGCGATIAPPTPHPSSLAAPVAGAALVALSLVRRRRRRDQG